jgi:hypothetical protein
MEQSIKSKSNNAEIYEQHIKNWQQSNLSQEKYCKSVNIPYSAFSYWRSNLKNKKTISKKQSSFLPVLAQPPSTQIKPNPLISEHQKIIILTPSGIQLSFPIMINPNILADHVKAMGRIS